jgi:hypothetical protein
MGPIRTNRRLQRHPALPMAIAKWP